MGYVDPRSNTWDQIGRVRNVTRREFVSIVGAVTGRVALGMPGDNEIEMLSATAPAETKAGRSIKFVPVEFRINGRMRKWSIDPRVTLLDLLRDYAGLTGTKKGCDHGQCGAGTSVFCS